MNIHWVNPHQPPWGNWIPRKTWILWMEFIFTIWHIMKSLNVFSETGQVVSTRFCMNVPLVNVRFPVVHPGSVIARIPMFYFLSRIFTNLMGKNSRKGVITNAEIRHQCAKKIPKNKKDQAPIIINEYLKSQ